MEESFALGDAFSWFIQERCYPQATLYQISIIKEAEGATFQGDKVEGRPRGDLSTSRVDTDLEWSAHR